MNNACLKRFLFIAAVAALACASSGCSRPATNVSGKVMINGKPIAGGQISFVDKTGSKVHTANIEPDGSYQLPDVPLGEMTVLVFGPRAPLAVPPGREGAAKKIAANKATPAIDIANVPPVHAKYGDVSTSDLRYTVISGPNTYDPPLK